MKNQPIYLDYNATTPVDERVLEAMMPYFTNKFGNAASIQHPFGWDAEEAVSHARDQVASLLGVKSQHIVFTSGATEAINLGIQGAFNSSEKNHIITCCTEHKAVLDTCEFLKCKGAIITLLDVNADGLIDLDQLKEAITKQTLMVSLMSANNETGVLQDIQTIGALCHDREILFFTDITQSAGKSYLNLEELKIDLAAFSSHKLYGPKGVGALYIKDASTIEPIVYGGGHEKGLRSGTLNVPGIVGFGKACDLTSQGLENESLRLGKMRDEMEQAFESLGGISINGAKANRLPHVSNVSFENIDGAKLMRSLKGLAISQGSACNSSVIEPSHVLKAMGLSDGLAYSSLRISLGRPTTTEEIDQAIEIIKKVIEQQRLQPL